VHLPTSHHFRVIAHSCMKIIARAEAMSLAYSCRSACLPTFLHWVYLDSVCFRWLLLWSGLVGYVCSGLSILSFLHSFPVSHVRRLQCVAPTQVLRDYILHHVPATGSLRSRMAGALTFSVLMSDGRVSLSIWHDRIFPFGAIEF
jgi:hypothetical protein